MIALVLCSIDLANICLIVLIYGTKLNLASDKHKISHSILALNLYMFRSIDFDKQNVMIYDIKENLSFIQT